MSFINKATSSIRRPVIQAKHFQIKPTIIQMIQHTVEFDRFSYDDQNCHIEDLLEIYDTFKYNELIDDVIHMRLFPFSLRDKVKI